MNIVYTQHFDGTLQQAQRNLYDIERLLLNPLKKQEKITKYKKIGWYLVAGTECAISATFGILAVIDFCNQRYFSGVLYTGLSTIGAMAASNAIKITKTYIMKQQENSKIIETTQTLINTASPEKLHEMAEIARQNNQQR